MNKIIKKINFKVILLSIFLVAFQSLIFFFTKPFVTDPYILGSALDNAIPYVPHFIWIYVFWYFMLFAVPYYIAQKNTTSLYKYTATYIITVIISGIIFISFPNSVIRAEITGTDIPNRLVSFIYNMDTPAINCLPSIHCLLSYLFILAVFDAKKDTSALMKTIITILSILVVLSTLFIKQHVVYDAVASLVLAIIVWIIVDKTKIYNVCDKILKKIIS